MYRTLSEEEEDTGTSGREVRTGGRGKEESDKVGPAARVDVGRRCRCKPTF